MKLLLVVAAVTLFAVGAELTVSVGSVHAVSQLGLRIRAWTDDRLALQASLEARDAESSDARGIGDSTVRGISIQSSDASSGFNPVWCDLRLLDPPADIPISAATRKWLSDLSYLRTTRAPLVRIESAAQEVANSAAEYSLFAGFNLMIDDLGMLSRIVSESHGGNVPSGFDEFLDAVRATRRARAVSIPPRSASGHSQVSSARDRVSAFLNAHQSIAAFVHVSAGINADRASRSVLQLVGYCAGLSTPRYDELADRLVSARENQRIEYDTVRAAIYTVVRATAVDNETNRILARLLVQLGISTDVWRLTARSDTAMLSWFVRKRNRTGTEHQTVQVISELYNHNAIVPGARP